MRPKDHDVALDAAEIADLRHLATVFEPEAVEQVRAGLVVAEDESEQGGQAELGGHGR